MIRTKLYLPLLAALLLLLGGCDKEDDIQSIFYNTTWKVVYTAYTTNWDDANTYTPEETFIDDIRNMEAYVVYFGSEVIQIKGKTAVWKGTWSADGKDRTIQIKIQEKNHEGQTAAEQTFLDRVSRARYYKGDTNILKLFLDDQHSFVQFRPIN